MQLFSREEWGEWDRFTIENEPVASIDLMERAAAACSEAILNEYGKNNPFHIFCGKGNNGGDGLAIGRMLYRNGCPVSIYIMGKEGGSPEFEKNLNRWLAMEAPVHIIESRNDFPSKEHLLNGIIIDALFGTGLNRPLNGIPVELVDFLNETDLPIVSIDVPSGLFIDAPSMGNTIVKARHTFTFQALKTACLLPENAIYTGRVRVLDIRLHPGFLKDKNTLYHTIDPVEISNFFQLRKPFSHKGNFGHALLIAGSPGMMGAAVLAASACVRAGVGKLTVMADWEERSILQASVPTAMVIRSGSEAVSHWIKEEKIQGIGIGPGWGTEEERAELLQLLLEKYRKPMVFDADALNLLAKNGFLWESIPPGSILTPHPGEFSRLSGKFSNDYERLEKALALAKQWKVYIILKGRFSFLATPEGKGIFNTTGNPGMANGGSGDALTGLLTGLLAQGLSPIRAAIAGMYLHGLAGDLAAKALHENAMNAFDLIAFLPRAFSTVSPSYAQSFV